MMQVAPAQLAARAFRAVRVRAQAATLTRRVCSCLLIDVICSAAPIAQAYLLSFASVQETQEYRELPATQVPLQG